MRLLIANTFYRFVMRFSFSKYTHEQKTRKTHNKSIKTIRLGYITVPLSFSLAYGWAMYIYLTTDYFLARSST